MDALKGWVLTRGERKVFFLKVVRVKTNSGREGIRPDNHKECKRIKEEEDVSG